MKVTLRVKRFEAGRDREPYWAEYEVEALLADYTRRQPQMTRILQRFGRAGVPMYLIFPAGRPAEYILLPEVLTTGLVRGALAEASGERAVAAAR